MKSIAVYTALFGPFDKLPEPPLDPQCDYFCFTDNRSLRSTRFEILHVDSTAQDATRLARYHKVLSHRVLPQYRHTLWIDPSTAFRFEDVGTFVHQAIRQHPIATQSHPCNDDVYLELERCIYYREDDPEVLHAQIRRYRAQGLPEGTGMVASGVIVRDGAHPKLREFEEGWWREIELGSTCDQLSFQFVSWKMKFPYAVFAPLDWGPFFRSQYFDFEAYAPPP